MSWQMIVFGILPLVVFVVLDMKASKKSAVIGAFAVAALEALAMKWMTSSWDPISLVAVALIGILGYVTFKRDDDTYFKLQPAVLAIIMAGFVAYIQFFDDGIWARYGDMMLAMMPPEKAQIAQAAGFQQRFHVATSSMVFSLPLYALAITYCALRKSSAIWIAMRAVGIWVFLVAGWFIAMAGWVG